MKKLLSITRNKKNMAGFFCSLKIKLNSIETLVSQALTDMEISNEKFNTIRKEKKNTRR